MGKRLALNPLMSKVRAVISGNELIAYLDSHGIAYKAQRHTPVFTMTDVLTIALELEGIICKNILLSNGKGKFFLVATEPFKRLDLKALRQQLGEHRLSFAPESDLHRLLGVGPGALSCLALINDTASDVTMILDSQLENYAFFLMHPLDNCSTLQITLDHVLAFLMLIEHPPLRIQVAGRGA
jgi:Ala-tRNA(Pro) deacylase